MKPEITTTISNGQMQLLKFSDSLLQNFSKCVWLMILARHSNKVFYSVIIPDAIQMMNYPSFRQKFAIGLLPNKDMFSFSFATFPYNHITTVVFEFAAFPLWVFLPFSIWKYNMLPTMSCLIHYWFSTYRAMFIKIMIAFPTSLSRCRGIFTSSFAVTFSTTIFTVVTWEDSFKRFTTIQTVKVRHIKNLLPDISITQLQEIRNA